MAVNLADGAVDLLALADVIVVTLAVCALMPGVALSTPGICDAAFHPLLVHRAP